MDNGFFFNSGGSPPPLHFEPAAAAWGFHSDQSPDCFLAPNWERPADHSHSLPFDSALNSMVSSPAASISNVSGDSFVIRELIGKLGTVCNSGDILCTPGNASCYSTPRNSPPNLRPLNSAEFPADPGFAERAAKLSCFGSMSFNGRPAQTQLGLHRSHEFQHRSTPLMENGKLPRVSSSPSLKPQLYQNQNQNQNPPLMQHQDQTQLANSQEESTVSEQNPFGENRLKTQNEPNSRKRKSGSKGKGKDSAPTPSVKEADEDSTPKKCKVAEVETKKLPEPPKDYIHVRARRGQATDSHSLAERVRREKISERMRLLQDLVPGCNKVTGKALMLDEIINYVQSLQRQVEFLSMKLASVNTNIDFNMGSLTPKDIFGSNNSSMLQPMHTLDSSASVLFGQNQAIQGLLDGFGEVASQHLTFFGDDLQSLVQMGFSQNTTLMSQNVQGSNQGSSEMKIEL